MTATQTSVAAKAAAYAGMISDASRDTNLRSYTSEEASAEIQFGTFVAQGVAEKGMLKLAAITDRVVGVLVNSQAFAKDVEVGDTGLKPKMTASVMTRGRVWVLAEEAMTFASVALIRAIVAGSEVAGSVRDTADGADTIDKTAGWLRVLTGSTGAGLVEVEFDIANFLADPVD